MPPTTQQIVTFIRNRTQAELLALQRYLAYESVRRVHVTESGRAQLDTAIGYIQDLTNPQAAALERFIKAEAARRQSTAEDAEAEQAFNNS